MTAFLASLNYNAWILPVLLLLPVVGGALVWAHGAVAGQGDGASMTARRITLAVLVLECVLSLGLWWSLDRANAKFQRRFESIEALASERGIDVRTAGLEVLDSLWDEVKGTES